MVLKTESIKDRLEKLEEETLSKYARKSKDTKEENTKALHVLFVQNFKETETKFFTQKHFAA